MAYRRNSRPLQFQAVGLSDAEDGAAAFPGAMAVLTNLIRDPKSKNFVARPASVSLTAFAGFTAPAQITALMTIGTRIYGMLASGDFAAKDEPFCFDTATGLFVAITGTAVGNLPATQATVGDWQPPHMEMVGQRIIVTHPGFPGGAGAFFGWIDLSGFTSNTLTGTTVNASKTVTTLSANPINAGWKPGMTISASNGDIPASTTIVSMTANTVTITNAMTAGHAGGTLTVTGGTSAAPQWGSGNCNTNPLVSVPAWVSQYNGRAWYAVANSLVFSDALNPTQVSNTTAVQVLTAGSNVNFTAMGGVPLNNLTGGVVQSLFAFQGTSAIYQVTGDQATSNLAFNQLSTGPVGTTAPNSLVSTPLGLVFVAQDGMRVVDLNGRVSNPVGAYGDGVTAPFINAQFPTRICAAYSENCIRLSLSNAAKSGVPREEYWFDVNGSFWSGPHSFPADQIEALPGSGFVLAASGINGRLWTSTTLPTAGASYTENGVAMTYVWQQVLQPGSGDMAESCIIDSTLMAILDGNVPVTAKLIDDTGTPLGQATIQYAAGTSTWGGFLWGQGSWGVSGSLMYQWRIPWSGPLVFKQAYLQLTGSSSANLTIGMLRHRVRELGYMLQRA